MSKATDAITAARLVAAVTKEFDENEFVATICTAMQFRQEKTGEDLKEQARKIAWAISKSKTE